MYRYLFECEYGKYTSALGSLSPTRIMCLEWICYLNEARTRCVCIKCVPYTTSICTAHATLFSSWACVFACAFSEPVDRKKGSPVCCIRYAFVFMPWIWYTGVVCSVWRVWQIVQNDWMHKRKQEALDPVSIVCVIIYVTHDRPTDPNKSQRNKFKQWTGKIPTQRK